jgi:hypothetical protein
MDIIVDAKTSESGQISIFASDLMKVLKTYPKEGVLKIGAICLIINGTFRVYYNL